MAFTTSRLLGFGDCDPSGIAYFPQYLHILVGVEEEFFASFGVPWHELMAKRKIGLPTLKLDLTFVHPGYHGDVLEFTARVAAIGRSSCDLDYAISAKGTLLWTARERLVCSSLETQKSIPWPDDIRAGLERHLETTDAPHAST